MKKIILIAIALMLVGGEVGADSLNVECKSKSGLSKYNLAFDFSNMTGLIRYRFMGQDITYRATIDTNNALEVSGRARFESSRTGETRGNPFSFQYSKEDKIFKELNADNKCE